MKMSLVAQGFSPFQVKSITRDFDLKNIRLFSISISMKLLFHFLSHSLYGSYRSTAYINRCKKYTNVISKFARACAGHCLVFFLILDIL